jgi:hypothetical protein
MAAYLDAWLDEAPDDAARIAIALCNIQPVSRSIHLGPSVPQVVSVETQLWHVDAVRSGGSPSFRKGGRCPNHLDHSDAIRSERFEGSRF